MIEKTKTKAEHKNAMEWCAYTLFISSQTCTSRQAHKSCDLIEIKLSGYTCYGYNKHDD